MFCYICKKEIIEYTTSVSFYQYHILTKHNMTSKEYYDKYLKKQHEDICKHENCNNTTKFVNTIKGYREFCSIKCKNSSATTIDRIKKSNLEKYGTTCVFSNELIKRKIEQTNLEKYGAKNVFQSEEIKEKIKQINIEKYGYNSPSKNSLIRDKIKQTTLERYGVENILQNEDIKQKIKNTNLKKYGYEYASQNKEIAQKIKDKNFKNGKEINEKLRHAMLEKYGVEHAMQDPDILNKTRQTNIERYGYNNPIKNSLIQDKIRKTNLERYGFENPLQNEDIKQKIKETNMKKYGTENPFGCAMIKDCIKNTNLKKYGHKNVIYNNEVQNKIRRTYRKNYWDIFLLNLSKKNIIPEFNINFFINNDVFNFKCLLCDNHFTRDITNPQRINCGCLKYRSTYEVEIFDILKDIGIKKIEHNKDFMENRRKKYELDIFLEDYNFGIEFNGVYWHSDIFLDENYHQKKYLYFKNKNIKIIQIFENEWINNKELVISIIRDNLNLNEQIYAGKCDIKEITDNIYKYFLEENHIQGYKPAKIKFGLFHNNELISLASFGKSRSDKKIDIELIRFCNKKGISVLDALSKLLKHFKQKYIDTSIISYSDIRYFDSNSYLKSGFIHHGISTPNYFYFKPNEMILYDRIKFQKHKLQKILKIYDHNKSEYENMMDNGYLRIFDAGNDIFIIKDY